MILIMENDADREAFQRGSPFRQEFFDDRMRAPTVWISPETYAKDVVLAGLRPKVEALEEHIVERGELYVRRDDVLAVFDGCQ